MGPETSISLTKIPEDAQHAAANRTAMMPDTVTFTGIVRDGVADSIRVRLDCSPLLIFE
jgi:hypothetical protein